ncbi:hypothetical protein NliqN6_0480 [Naganishia liquefaciens]|uniref:PX domain-containing protein n=1 Tax=Naganishia liquefaciens TaxID=104408 RepID=A0A8H3TNL0_9TREE|nr:hypothetical protein NliqN6_0480 [Naganishia liquefaciens]
MAAQSSLTTSRLAALSLSPSRIAQLGVKHDARESHSSGDENVSSSREGKNARKAAEGDVVGGEHGKHEAKQEGLSVRPDLSRRSSTLESLSDEGDDDSGQLQGCGIEQEDDKGEESSEVKTQVNDAAGSSTIGTPPAHDSSPISASTSTASPKPANNTISTARAGSSRDRSPPPSYEHAILPSALQQSSAASVSTDQSVRSMSATARGKQRDTGNTNEGDVNDSRTATGSAGQRRGEPMLELLPNSDTEEEDVFSSSQIRTEPSTGTASERRVPNDPHHNPANRSPQTPAIFLPALGQPSSGKRRHRPLLAKSSRTRSSYTGPVEIIDRSGEGWADSLVEEDAASDSAEVYDVSSSHESLPARPNLASSTSSFIRSLPSPSSGAFTQDVRILGWKIVGGRTGKASVREGGGRAGDAETAEEHGHEEDQQKPRMGAYVVYECQVMTRQGTKILRMRRYNDFLALYNALRKAFPNAGASLPPLPPKNRLSKFEPTYLGKRQVKLQFWLKSVLLHPNLGAHEAVRRFVVDV